MIIVDSRSGSEPTKDFTAVDKLVSYIRNIGVPCDIGTLEYADIAFEGNAANGRVMIGIERKTIHDMLHSIDDSRYSATQKVGMRQMYSVSYLMLEGTWRPHYPMGTLVQGDGTGWWPCKYRSQPVLYAKLYRYLLSVALSGVIITQSNNLWHTAYNCCEVYHYFQKPFDQHTSMLATQKLVIPDLTGHPSLVRRWAADVDGIGVKRSIEAAELFRTPIALANSSEADWLSLSGVGAQTASRIVKQILGK